MCIFLLDLDLIISFPRDLITKVQSFTRILIISSLMLVHLSLYTHNVFYWVDQGLLSYPVINLKWPLKITVGTTNIPFTFFVSSVPLSRFPVVVSLTNKHTVSSCFIDHEFHIDWLVSAIVTLWPHVTLTLYCHGDKIGVLVIKDGKGEGGGVSLTGCSLVRVWELPCNVEVETIQTSTINVFHVSDAQQRMSNVWHCCYVDSKILLKIKAY